jgi:hypothetical protein
MIWVNPNRVLVILYRIVELSLLPVGKAAIMIKVRLAWLNGYGLGEAFDGFIVVTFPI